MANETRERLPHDLTSTARALTRAWREEQYERTDALAAAFEGKVGVHLDTLVPALRDHPLWLVQEKYRPFARTWFALAVVAGRQRASELLASTVFATIQSLLDAEDGDQRLAGTLLAGHLGAGGAAFWERLQWLTHCGRDDVKIAAKQSCNIIEKLSPCPPKTVFPHVTLPERPLPQPAFDPEKIRATDDALVEVREMARQKLRVLLAQLGGRQFSEKETDKAREAVRVVNHLSSLLGVDLHYKGVPVTLGCVYGSGRREPGFQLKRAESTRKTVLTTGPFPTLTAGD